MRFLVRPDGALGEYEDDSYAVTLAQSPEAEHAGWRFASAQEVADLVEATMTRLHEQATHHEALLEEVG